MYKSFVYGTAVSGENFTDRKEETARIKKDFEAGLNTILISPRRMGKTSLIKKVISEMTDERISIVFMDIYDCRSEEDFYIRFSQEILKTLSSGAEKLLENAKEFLGRLAPKLAISPDMNSEYSVSLGLSRKEIDPNQILNLPERIAEKRGVHIIICIDEFQQIGEFPESMTFQKKLRSVWQHQQRTSYCLFGSKKHMMENIFQNRRMPFYMFGDTIYLGSIPEKDWVEYICSRFDAAGIYISGNDAAEICHRVEFHSSYVQQLSWNVMLNADKKVTSDVIDKATEDLINQNEPLFMVKIENLTSFQLNMIRAICSGVHFGFTSEKVYSEWNIGSKSNISRIRAALIEKEIIEKRAEGLYMADPVFKLWFMKSWPTKL